LKRSLRHRAVRALALAVAFAGAPALAKPPTSSATHLELRAPSGCSSFEEFTALVRKRSARIHLTTVSAPRTLLVELQEAGGAYRGSVTVKESDGATRKRQLTARSCPEAVDALSLIAVVTLDPDALTAEPEPESEPEPEPPPEPKPTRPQPPRSKPKPTADVPPEPRAAPYRFSFAVLMSALFRHAPGVALGGSAAFAVELHPGRVVSPLFRLSVLHAEERQVRERGGDASFAYTVPLLDVCPVRIGSRWFGLRPCAYGGVGALYVWGSAASQGNESHWRPSGSAGSALLASLRVSEDVEIIADGRAGVAFPRDKFGFDRTPFHSTPTLGFSASLGVAGGFP